MFKRTLLTAATTVALTGVTGMAFAVSPGGDEAPDSQGQVVINGRAFGPKDGLVTVTGEIPLSTGASPAGVTALVGASPTTWGSSYVKNTETAQLRYTGEAYAAANLYNSKRVIQVCFQYRRNGENLTGEICSSANSNGGRWTPGKVARSSVWDSLRPRAPKTTFHYWTQMINPNVS